VAIEAVLFDADGVLQRPGAAGRARLVDLAGGVRRLDAFLADVFAAEDLCLDGTRDLRAALAPVLERWECAGRHEHVLGALNDIEPDADVLAHIASLRRRGLPCYLATNQQPHRARHMHVHLGYARLFDGAFYSCDVGAAKPARAYFEAVLRALNLRAERVLFLDDHEENAAAARALGLQGVRFPPGSGAAGLRRVLAPRGLDALREGGK